MRRHGAVCRCRIPPSGNGGPSEPTHAMLFDQHIKRPDFRVTLGIKGKYICPLSRIRPHELISSKRCKAGQWWQSKDLDQPDHPSLRGSHCPSCSKGQGRSRRYGSCSMYGPFRRMGRAMSSFRLFVLNYSRQSWKMLVGKLGPTLPGQANTPLTGSEIGGNRSLTAVRHSTEHSQVTASNSQ